MEPSKSMSPYGFCDESGTGGRNYDTEDEYYDNIENGLSEDYDPLKPLQPLIPLKYTCVSSTFETDNNSSHENDALELFFNTFIDQELDGEITMCQFVSSLTELSIELTEKDLYKVFNFIDHDKSGYLDAVDFVQFFSDKCLDNNDNTTCNMKQLQSALLSAIKSHPFIINISKVTGYCWDI